MVRCGMLSPGLVLNLRVLLFHSCHGYELLGNSPRLRAVDPGASVYLSMACCSPEVPRVPLREGKVRWQLGGGRGGCASCPPHPRPRLGGSGRGCVSLGPALSDWSQAPLAALLVSLSPAGGPHCPSGPPSGTGRVPLCPLGFRNSRCHFPGLATPAGLPPITVLSGVVGRQAVEWTWRPRATQDGSELESFGRQATGKITAAWGQ